MYVCMHATLLRRSIGTQGDFGFFFLGGGWLAGWAGYDEIVFAVREEKKIAVGRRYEKKEKKGRVTKNNRDLFVQYAVRQL